MIEQTISLFGCQCDSQFLSDKDFGEKLLYDLLKDIHIDGDIYIHTYKNGYFCSIYFKNAEVNLMTLVNKKEIRLDFSGKNEKKLSSFLEIIKKVFLPLNIRDSNYGKVYKKI